MPKLPRSLADILKSYLRKKHCFLLHSGSIKSLTHVSIGERILLSLIQIV